MIFDSHMHVGDFPLFNVSLDRVGLAALMRETGIDEALLFSPDSRLIATMKAVRAIAITAATIATGTRQSGAVRMSVVAVPHSRHHS